jgi:transglutaminase-like putative cysteine protease
MQRKSHVQGAGARGQGPGNQVTAESSRRLQPAQNLTTGERFEKTLDAIRENVARAGEKLAKDEDDIREREAIKAKRAEIESADAEFKKEFAATEKKLKDAKLPKEILARHAKFVKHYEDNLKELRANLDDIDAAKTGAARKAKVEKARLHLEKVKAPSRHQKLDPNNLPFKVRKATKIIAPRLKKEYFEHDFPQQKSRNKRNTANSRLLSDLLASKPKQKPVLLVFNEFESDIPFQLPRPIAKHVWSEGAIPQVVSADATPFLLAQAIDQPSAEDLSETPDVQFTDAIRVKALELEGKPVQIYEWVRNNIEYAPTYGSIQGADMCLQTKICNDMDTASLLIALLRVSGVYAHYEYSTIEIPIEKAMNWIGGVTDPRMVGTILATNGIPAKVLISGDAIKAVQLEHVFVKAWIDYIPSRGAVHNQGNTWIPLDPSFKQYQYRRGMDLYTAMSVSGEKYLLDYITDTSVLTVPSELQTSFPEYTISPYQFYSKRLFSYVNVNFPAATYQDVFGTDKVESSKTIIKKEYPYLLGNLPYNVIVKGATYSSIPDSLRLSVSFTIKDDADPSVAGLVYITTLPEIAGNRITLSYIPATTADESLLDRYGTLLSVPPYLLNVKAVLKINGITVATGTPIGLGQEQTFDMNFTIPNIGPEFVTNKVIAGDYSAIVILSNNVPYTLIGDKMGALISNIGSSDLDDLLGQMLFNVGVSYFHHLNFEEELYAKNFQMFVVKGLSEAIITSHAIVNPLFGVAYNISEGGIGIDVDKNEYFPFSNDGSLNRARDFMFVSGLGSSAWEDRVLQTFYEVPSVSAARLLRLANQQGISVYTIDGSNIDTILSQLSVSSVVINDIENAINAGKKVVISKTGVQYEGWNGIGYIILDPATGAAGYMISSGTSGGMTGRQPATSVRSIFQYFWGDGSALKTIFGRSMIVMIALAQLETPYVDSGADPITGFDCSGLIYYLYSSVYGKKIFPYKCGNTSCGGGCAICQHAYIEQKNWTHPYDEKLDGDILWSDDYGHTGIYYGIPSLPGELIVTDSVIHANRGNWFSKVIITSTNNAAFTGAPSGSLMTDMGRPDPALIYDIPF